MEIQLIGKDFFSGDKFAIQSDWSVAFTTPTECRFPISIFIYENNFFLELVLTGK